MCLSPESYRQSFQPVLKLEKNLRQVRTNRSRTRTQRVPEGQALSVTSAQRRSMLIPGLPGNTPVMTR